MFLVFLPDNLKVFLYFVAVVCPFRWSCSLSWRKSAAMRKNWICSLDTCWRNSAYSVDTTVIKPLEKPGFIMGSVVDVYWPNSQSSFTSGHQIVPAFDSQTVGSWGKITEKTSLWGLAMSGNCTYTKRHRAKIEVLLFNLVPISIH